MSLDVKLLRHTPCLGLEHNVVEKVFVLKLKTAQVVPGDKVVKSMLDAELLRDKGTGLELVSKSGVEKWLRCMVCQIVMTLV